ncbi:CagY family CD-EC repeat-containing protein [Helicobacter pylori]|uniref:CagY family CD-EC repeat-containing protein n=1 Tax=Helicobacter pylori TaxID=210 RepID=UPI003A6442D6
MKKRKKNEEAKNSQAKTEAYLKPKLKLKKECEKLLTPEAKKLLEEAKESLKAYKDCVSQAKTEEAKESLKAYKKNARNCEKLLTPEATSTRLFEKR